MKRRIAALAMPDALAQDAESAAARSTFDLIAEGACS